jgi:murein DD-endopeptidase MepM/ murein hydrolase activator NlpD
MGGTATASAESRRETAPTASGIVDQIASTVIAMPGGRTAHGRFAGAAVAVTVLFGCAPSLHAGDSAGRSFSNDPARSLTATDRAAPPTDSTPSTTAASPPSASDPSQPNATGPKRPPSAPKNVTFTKDHHYYSSPWYDGAWQEMIGFGCTEAPYYPRDRSCPRSKPGRHHGIDTFMLCGTKVRSAVTGRVVRNPAIGSAYGKHGLVIRHGRFDFVIGHARRLTVSPGQQVKPGQLIAISGKSGAPDGCHLHFEKRPAGQGYISAINPLKSLRRTVVRFPRG